MQRAGMTFSAILDSLTTAPADALRDVRTTGRVLAGMDADLIVLDADPAADIAAFTKVRTGEEEGYFVYAGDQAG